MQAVSLQWRPFCVPCQQEEFEKAMHWYESTLKLQPEFAPAKDRLRTIQCYLLTKRDRRQPWTTEPAWSQEYPANMHVPDSHRQTRIWIVQETWY